MKRPCLIFILIFLLLLAGCGQEKATPAYDYDLAEYIQLGPYKEIRYVPYGDTRRSYALPEDTVTAEVLALVDGDDQLFAGVYTFQVGYSNFLDGFDEALVGMEVGSTAALELKIPDVYESAPEYAGHSVEVQVRLLELDLSAYEEMNRQALWQIVLDSSQVLRYPEAELAAYEADFRACFEAFAAQYGMDLDRYLQTFFGTDSAGLDRLCRENAETSVKRDLVLYAIARAESLVPGAGELEAAKSLWLATYGYANEEDMPADWSDPEVAASLEKLALQNMVQSYIYENALPQ